MPQSRQARTQSAEELSEAVGRVCDSCIRRKVKCDLGRPACSRCVERGLGCNYSSIRRKPGPSRGSRRRTFGWRQRRATPIQPDGATIRTETPDTPDPDSHLVQSESTHHIKELRITAQEQELLLNKYMDTIHHAIPLFNHPECIRDPERNTSLLQTVAIITGKLVDFRFTLVTNDCLDAHIERLLSSGELLEELLGDSPSLDALRKACLLAFYEFHQFPGQQAWLRIGQLVRIAYWLGMDALDGSMPHPEGAGGMTRYRTDDWRLLWWCIYRLDSYANLSAGMPYMIGTGTMNVALLGSCDEPDVMPPTAPAPITTSSLLRQLDSLWEVVPKILCCEESTASFNLHIVTVTALRHVGHQLQHYIRAPGDNFSDQVSDLELHLSTFRLALPDQYFNPTRNALLDEAPPMHHQRLISILHMHFARFLIAIIKCRLHVGREEWLLSWQTAVEAAQDMAAVAEQWNGAFTLHADPAICYILFSAMTFVHLQRKSQFASLAGAARLRGQETAVFLLLEQFAKKWTQVTLLILAFKSVQESLKGPLLQNHIQLIISRFEAPLHPKWVRFLSSIQSSLDIFEG